MSRFWSDPPTISSIGGANLVSHSTDLELTGPLIKVVIHLSDAMVIGLSMNPQRPPLPALIPGIAMIDTGASRSCVDGALARRAGIPETDTASIHSLTHGGSAVLNCYPVRIEIPGTPFRANVAKAIGAALPSGLVALIGRDVLSRCSLLYDGVGQRYTLRF